VNRIRVLGLLAVLSAMLLTACEGSTVVETVVVKEPVVETVIVEGTPQVVEKQVEVTRIVKEEVVITPTAEPFKPKGEIVIALPMEIDSLEYAYAAGYTMNAAATMADTLLRKPWFGDVEPALAESWEMSEDGTEYIFHLRKDVTFHNGDPFTAEDVVYTWQTYNVPQAIKSTAWSIAESVEAIDQHTVRMTTSASPALFLMTLAGTWYVIPAAYHQDVGAEEFALHPIGTGPFMFQEWVKGDHLTVVANPNYWREGAPKLEKITFKVIPDPATRVASLRTGQIDLAPRLTSTEAESLMGQPNIRIVRYKKLQCCQIEFNNVTTGIDTPIIDQRVRQAMNYAINVQEIIDAVFDGYAKPTAGFITDVEIGYDQSLEPYPFDPEKAKQLLAEAGYPDGFKINMACPDQGYDHINEVCMAVVGYLADVGVDVELEFMEATHFWELEAAQQLPPMLMECWGSLYPEPFGKLKGALTTEGGWYQWYDEDLQEMILQLPWIVDFDERLQLYSTIQQYMWEDPPFVYLHQPEAFEGINALISGYEPNPREGYELWNVSLREEQ
jgi:peptide/nickel transport system substrate-binding protein